MAVGVPQHDEPAALAATLAAQLGPALSPLPGGPLQIPLALEPMLYRLGPARPVSRFARPQPTPADAAPQWHLVSPLRHLFSRLLLNLPACQRLVRWGDVALPLHATVACRWAAWLIRQMGATSDLAEVPPGWPRDLEARFAACQRHAAAGGTALAGIAGEMLDALAPDPRNAPHAAPLVRLEAAPAGPVAVWRDAAEAELCREPLAALVGRIADRAGRAIVREVEAQRAARQAQRDAGDATLSAISPRLAAAARLARDQDRCVGVRLCRVKARGLPAEVCLFLDIVPDSQQVGRVRARVALEAIRAHEEYLLQSAAGRYFYFPPCQLVARFVFENPPPNEWRVYRPYVRAIQGAPSWLHPYVGSMYSSRYCQALWLDDVASEASLPISEEGQRLVPRDAGRLQTAVEGDMCLSNQDFQVQMLGERIARDLAAGNEPDLFLAVRTLWNTARLGLTRGHQMNTRIPRVSLVGDRLRYEIKGTPPRTGTLASRIFPYNPSTAV